MKILIVSDTHGEDEQLEEVMTNEMPFDVLVHCGDVEGREEYIEVIAECPSYIVAGNMDYFSDLRAEETFEAGEHRIFVTHGHIYGVSWDLDKLVSAAIARNCDVALFGHIHVPVIEKIDGVLCINPGSLAHPRQENRKPSYAVLEIPDDGSGEMQAEICYL